MVQADTILFVAVRARFSAMCCRHQAGENDHFHVDAKNYVAENDAASEGHSQCVTKGYGSENHMFASSLLPDHWRKMHQMLLRKFMGLDGEISISDQSASREPLGDLLENICGGKNEKNCFKQH